VGKCPAAFVLWQKLAVVAAHFGANNVSQLLIHCKQQFTIAALVDRQVLHFIRVGIEVVFPSNSANCAVEVRSSG